VHESSPRQNSGFDLIPWQAWLIRSTILGQPSIKFATLRVREFHGFWDGGDAIPNVFDELDPLGNAHFEDFS
jgi:hypothetical protein